MFDIDWEGMVRGVQETYDKFDRFGKSVWADMFGQDYSDSYTDVEDFARDLVDYGTYHPERSLIPGYDSLYKFLDDMQKGRDYYKNTGRQPAYGSDFYTFGSYSDLGSSMLRNARDGLFAVGKTSRWL